MTLAELPQWHGDPGDPAQTIRAIDSWAKQVVTCGLVAAFGENPIALHGEQLLDFLESFASKSWDFRAGRERNLATAPVLSRAQRELIRDAVGSLGLDGTAPPRKDHYDAVVMTGGMVRAGIVKPRHLRDLTDAGLSWREAVFLGAFRTFAGDELAVAARLGVEGANEFDAMKAGVAQAFGPLAGSQVDECANAGDRGADSWRVESWMLEGALAGRRVSVVAAPSSDPSRRRANTVDTYRFWARRATSIRSVLVITTPVYVPYQGAGAIEVFGLEFGFAVETVAVGERASDLGPDTQQFLAHHQLQELRSAIHGMRSLRSRLAPLVAGPSSPGQFGV